MCDLGTFNKAPMSLHLINFRHCRGCIGEIEWHGSRRARLAAEQWRYIEVGMQPCPPQRRKIHRWARKRRFAISVLVRAKSCTPFRQGAEGSPGEARHRGSAGVCLHLFGGRF